MPTPFNAVVPNVYATWVFTPTPSVTGPSVSVFNNGTNVVYLGGAGVNQADGFPLPPGNRPLRLQNIGYPLYACGNVAVGAIAGTLSTAYTAGTTQIVTAASVSSSVTGAGSVLIIGNTLNTGWEAIVVGTRSTSGTTFGTTAFVSDHASGAAGTIYAATALPTSVVVQAGVL